MAKFFVSVKPGAYEERVEQQDATHFTIAVREPPEKGLANRAVCRAVAIHLAIPQSRVSIRSGFTSRHKVVEVS